LVSRDWGKRQWQSNKQAYAKIRFLCHGPHGNCKLRIFEFQYTLKLALVRHEGVHELVDTSRPFWT
jgi:hypothetical protein